MFEESHPKIGTKTATETAALWHLGAMVVATAWLAGGAAIWAGGFLMALGVIGIGIFVVHRLRGNFRTRGNLRRYCLFLIPPAAAIVLFLLGLLRRSMETIVVDGREMFILSPAQANEIVNIAPLNGWMPLLVYSLIYISALNIWFIFESRWTIRRLLNVVVISTAFLTVVGFMQMLIGVEKVGGVFSPPANAFFSIFPHADLWTAYALAVFGLGLALSHLIKFHQSWQYFLTSSDGITFYLSCLIGFSVILQPTFYGVTGLLLISAVFFAFEAGGRYRSSRKSATLAGITNTVIAILLIAAAVYSALFHLPAILNQPLDAVTETTFLDERKALLRDSVVAFSQRPVLGWGVGSYPLVFAFFQEVDLRGGFYAHSGSSLLNLLIERGVVGTLVWILPLLLMLVAIDRNEMRGFSSFLVLLSFLMLVPSILSFAFASPAFALLFWIFLISGFRWIDVEKDSRMAVPKTAPTADPVVNDDAATFTKPPPPQPVTGQSGQQ